jgi:acyl-CoA synthetase (AMP-forming)/AMP-acid ligase II/acyl carrier protein
MSIDSQSHDANLFELICNNDEDRSAVLSTSGSSLSYGDLLCQIRYVGSVLRTLHVKRSDTIIVVLPNGPCMATCFLAVASYSTCAPLNPQFAGADLEFYISDLRPSAIILPADVDSPARELARKRQIKLLELDTSSEACAGDFRFRGFESELTANDDFSRADDVALKLHTSGTTSRPKLVPLTHSNLRSSASAIANTLALTPDDTCLNVMPLFHIHGLVGVLLSSMWAGGKVICTEGFDRDQISRWLSNCKPTWYSAVPTIHQSVLEAVRQSSSLDGHRLRFIRSSSSALPPQLMAELESTFGVPVIEAYGMTEASHQMSSNPLPPAARKAGSVGKAAGPRVSIIDDQGQHLEHGKVGEIVIQGPGVMAGYVDNPDANATAFLQGWFRTGDLGRLDEDGYLFINGRKKEIINRGGEKISPREIDEAILEHPAVQQAIAFAVPHASLGEDVAVAVVIGEKNEADEVELRRFLFERLVPFKVPSRILIVDSIPKGATGKPQRIGLYQALEKQFRTDFVAPRTELECAVVAVFENVLQTSPVGVKDNFFALGGDSLKAVRALAALSRDYHIELPAVTVFHHPTPEQLSLEITRVLSSDAGLLDELLSEIEGISDEEARRQLE